MCKNLRFWLGAMIFSISTVVVSPVYARSLAEKQSQIDQQSNIFPIELSVMGKSTKTTILVRSQSQEKNKYSDWLLPLDTVAQALNLQVIPRENNINIELRSPSKNILIATESLQVDPQLGLVVSPTKLEELLNIESELNEKENRINLTPEWLALREQTLEENRVDLNRRPEVEIEIEGVKPLNDPGTISPNTNYPQNLAVRGEILGGEWYVRLHQADVENRETINLQEAQYSYQSESADYLIGLQPQSWLGDNRGRFWGFTTIQRWGFTPGVSSNQVIGKERMQAQEIGRTIVGNSKPSTLVELVKKGETEAIATTTADAEGNYRFDQIPSVAGKITHYQVRFYESGEVTEEPTSVENLVLATMENQLPAGASALMITGGTNQEMSAEETFLGKINDLHGGISYRLGVTEELTFGLKFGYNELFSGLGELLYQPTSIPLQISLSVLTDQENEDWKINSQLIYQPTPDLQFNWQSNRQSHYLGLNWEAFPGLDLFLSGHYYQDIWTGKMGLKYTNEDFGAIATARLNQANELLWTFSSHLGHFQLVYQDQAYRKLGEISYNFSNTVNQGHGHWIFTSYEYYNRLDDADNLAIVGWRYRSPQEAVTGGFWQFDLGYGFGSVGTGFSCAATRQLVRGLSLKVEYQSVSVNGDNSVVKLKLLPNFDIFSGSRQWRF